MLLGPREHTEPKRVGHDRTRLQMEAIGADGACAGVDGAGVWR